MMNFVQRHQAKIVFCGRGGSGGGGVSRDTASKICTVAGAAVAAGVAMSPAGKGAGKAVSKAVNTGLKAAGVAGGTAAAGMAVHAACTSIVSANYSGAPNYGNYNAMGDYGGW
jgi:hypothetical protein